MGKGISKLIRADEISHDESDKMKRLDAILDSVSHRNMHANVLSKTDRKLLVLSSLNHLYGAPICGNLNHAFRFHNTVAFCNYIDNFTQRSNVPHH